MVDGDVVARSELDLPVVHVIRFAVEMARAVPDASLSVEEADSINSIALVEAGRLAQQRRIRCLPLNLGPVKPSEGTLAQWGSQDWTVEEDPLHPGEDESFESESLSTCPWDLLDAGKIDAAITAFREEGIDGLDKERVTSMLTSDSPQEVIAACWVCRLTRWDGGLTNAEGLLFHGDPQVRQEAVAYVSSIAPERYRSQIHLLTQDADENVQRLAQTILEALGQRGDSDGDS